MFHPDYEALRQSRSDADVNSHNSKDSLEILLRVKTADIPLGPDLMLENHPPLKFVVTERLIPK